MQADWQSRVADAMRQATVLNMDLSMARAFWIMILVTVSPGPASASGGELSTYLQYKKNRPVILHINYHGGIAQWDAGASIANGTLILSNAMFISITNSKGDKVKPVKNRVISVWADTFFRDPFSLVLDISRFYRISETGKYIVRWGCKDVMADSIAIEIIDNQMQSDESL